MNNIYLQLLDFQRTDSPLVLATLTRSVGSTPQKPGSSALFNLTGLISGTVGGGVLEGEVQQIAQRAIQSKESGFYHFKLDKEISHGEGAICGGQVSVLIDASPGDHRIVFEQVKQSLINRTPGVLVTMVTNVAESGIRIQRYWLTENENQTFPDNNGRKIAAEVQRLLSAGNPGDYRELKIPLPGEDHDVLFLLEPIFPLAHLVISGAGHIGKALTHIGKLLDFEVTVIDERTEYANPANLPDADHIILEDIGKALEELKKTTDTFVVIVTRGHKDDAKALKACIGSDVAFIGMIGSKNKVALMREDFIQHGWATPDEWKKIYAPIGLDIQSKSVQEIAISIAAQLVLVKNSKKSAYV
ncbi:MAG: XdhC family protein [Bacteroidia bacterium]|nr:XdhC family protein [Bacteroidia bacterium]